MSGQDIHIFNKISRRDFVKQSLLTMSALGLVPALATACAGKKNYKGGFVNDNAKTGHLLRDNKPATPVKTVYHETIIVGGGISGLSAANYLRQHNASFILLELADVAGGNSVSGKNTVSAYPWAAHYLPIVNNTNTELISFLHKHNIITDFDANGLPVYNEYYLCFDPEDRLFINGHWQDGLIPNFGVPAHEQKEISRFFELVKDYKAKTGTDGKPAFEIPLQNSSADAAFRDLDKISFSQFLNSHDYKSPHLLWYLNYCCKDDYGSDINNTSAYAGLHYFCARRASASNAHHSAVITWPEGNAFLANLLMAPVKDAIHTNHLVSSVELKNNKVHIICHNMTTNECVAYVCDKAILATPQYINHRILQGNIAPGRNHKELFEYSPWIVANITLKDLPQYDGEPLSWDNVIYGSESLGYVNACHQHLNRYQKDLVITYYKPYPSEHTSEQRKTLRERSYEGICEEIISDLNYAHQDLESYILSIDIKLIGHGMIKPKPDFIFNSALQNYREPVNGRLFFAHTDLSGISIFEEAYFQGTQAGKHVLNHV